MEQYQQMVVLQLLLLAELLQVIIFIYGVMVKLQQLLLIYLQEIILLL